MIDSHHVRIVRKMTKKQLILWLEDHGMFSLIAGWKDHSRDELENVVLKEMGGE